jgi:YHS domain-containing protein
MKRLLALALLLAVPGLLLPAAAATDADGEEAKEKLKELQDYIGTWKGTGGPDKPKPGPRDPSWSETLDWSWRFKGDDAWLSLDVKNGKFVKAGRLRYLPGRKVYQLTATDKDGKKLVFEGTLKNETLTLQRRDPDGKGTQQFAMNVAGDGVRFIYRVAHRDEGKTYWVKDFLVACTKEGESLGRAEKKNECVVSGGLGTMPVTYKGETYWVCCSGCKDAFNENPEKYIAEFKARRAGKK